MRWVILGDEWPGPPGGVGRWTARLAGGLAAVGEEVDVFVRARPGLESVPGVRLTPARGPRFSTWGGRWLASAARDALARADRVVAATWPAATGLAQPFDYVLHGSDWTVPPRDPIGQARVLARGRGWSVSQWLAADAAARGLIVAPLPAPIARGCVVPPRSQLTCLGLFARATSRKGGDRFVALVKALGCRGVVVGDGPELPRWRAAAGPDVAFLGALGAADAQRVMTWCDAVVLLSRADPDGSGAEGLGLVLLEAASRGIPSVGSAVGGIPEACDLVLTAPDDAGASAAAVRAWWTPERGRAAFARCAGHGTDALVQTLIAAGPPAGPR